MASRIVVNNAITFTQENLESISLEKATDVVGAELSADELVFSVFYDDSNSTLRNMPYASSVVYYEDETPVGTFFLTSVKRTASQRYTVESTSMIGILDKEQHYGGMYMAAYLQDVMEDIILSDGVSSSSYHNQVWFTSIINVPKRYLPWGTSSDPTYAQGRNCTNKTFTVRTRLVADFIWRDTHGYPWCGLSSEYEAHLYGANPYTDYGVVLQVANVNNARAGRLLLYLCGQTFTLRSPESSYNNAIEIGQHVYLDINPVAGTATVTIDGVTTTTDISSVQSTSSYINEATATSLGYYCGGYQTYSVGNPAEVEYFAMKLYDKSGTLQFDVHNIYWRRTERELRVTESVRNVWYNPNAGKRGRYTGSGTYAVNVKVSSKKAAIMNNIQYGDGVESLRVTGWLKPLTKREALYQLLFALSLNMKTGADGSCIIGGLADATAGTIASDDIYNSGSETIPQKTRNIFLTEHVYQSGSTSEVIFDNTETNEGSDGLAMFKNAPIMGTPVGNGITITAYNCNVAFISGYGTITGTPYFHGEKIHSENISSAADGRDITVSDATLVTYLNESNVMDRLKSYYNNAITIIKNAIVYRGQFCGNKYDFLDPFSESVSAFLSKITIRTSAITKANCEFVKGLTPVAPSGGYSHYVLLDNQYGGTWTVPTGVTQFHVILVGGGNGGDSGYAGENGQQLQKENPDHSLQTEWTTAYGGEGGMYGASGSGGKILEADITSPAASYSYTIGAGGNGGAECSSHITNNKGSAGGNTTFGSYSSATGAVRANGIRNIFTGTVYGISEPSWDSTSGKGGDGGWIEVISGHNIVYHNAESVYDKVHGITLSGGTNGSTYSSGGTTVHAGGAGMGGSWIQQINGENATSSSGGRGGNPTQSIGTITVRGGNRIASGYGIGGMGGFGGSGGGASGDNWGAGGYGYRGQAGASGTKGCIVIYY